MVQKDTHASFLSFVRRILEVPNGYSLNDLMIFKNAARRQFPAVVPLITAYLKLAEKAETGVVLGDTSKRTRGRARTPAQMHLFDMLRERRLFPLNTDLAEFAGRILPNMPRRRFDKMSRGDIAARIIEYLETLNPQTRETLEASMREAMAASPEKRSDRKSFFLTWERIIKGV